MKNAAIMSLLLPVSGLLSADHAWGQQAGGAVDLLKRYPTTLTEGSKSAGEAQAWEFTAADIYHLSEFRLHIGDSLHIEGGQAGLGLGHCPEGAVWAVVLPTEKARLTGSIVPKPGEIAHMWLRFHPNLISELFPGKMTASRVFCFSNRMEMAGRL